MTSVWYTTILTSQADAMALEYMLTAIASWVMGVSGCKEMFGGV